MIFKARTETSTSQDRYRPRWARIAMLVIGGIVLFSGGAPAGEGAWTLRASGVWVDPDGMLDRFDSEGERLESDADSAVGFGVTLERRLGARVGLEIGLPVIAEPDLRARNSSPAGEVISTRDALGIKVASAGVNIHLTPESDTDIYVGPFVGRAMFDDLSFPINELEHVRFTVADETVLGVVLGVDVPLGRRALFSATARYMTMDVEPRGEDGGAETLGLDTVALTAGFGLRF